VSNLFKDCTQELHSKPRTSKSDVKMSAFKGITFYRFATFLLLFFCTGHTVGGMLLQSSRGVEADAVFEAMKTVQFNFNGATCTWYNFWFGFGLGASINQLLSASIAWQLDTTDSEHWEVVRGIAWALVVAHCASAVLSWTYFFAGAGILSTLVTTLLAAGAWQKQSQAVALYGKKNR
jgi:hypothetical protein